MSLDVGQVVATLQRLLTEVNGAAATADVTLPERQYATTGGSVYDCEQVTVSANSMSVGLAGQAEGNLSVVDGCVPGWTVVVEMAIVRQSKEMPVGRRGTSAPTVEDIEYDTTRADADAAVLTSSVEAVAGPDWDQLGAVPATLQFGEVQGGLFAVVLTVTLNMWSIEVGP